MDKIERLLKEHLGPDLNKAAKTADCLSEQVSMDYFQRKLGQEAQRNAEGHLASCGFCRSQLNLIFEAGKVYKRGKGEGVGAIRESLLPELIKKAKALIRADRGLERKEMIRKKRITKNLFLVGAIVFFMASFFVPKYFFQFLVVTLILGMRWAFASEGGRTLIMVLDSWRRHSHNNDDEISHRLKDKFKSFHP